MKNAVETVTISKLENEELKFGYAELTAKVEWLMEQFRLA